MPDDRSSQDFGDPERTVRAPGPVLHGPTSRHFVAPTPSPRRAKIKFASVDSFVASQAPNISLSGMFVRAAKPSALGTLIDFECVTGEGVLLRGRAEVVMVSDNPAGMGLRFKQLDRANLKRVQQIVEANRAEGRAPTVPMEFATPIEDLPPSRVLVGATAVSSAVMWSPGRLVLQLNPMTVGYFVTNPLLNHRTGGFVVPADQDLALGTRLDVIITTMKGEHLWRGIGKVSAKQGLRLGLKLEAQGADLQRLQAEVTRLAPPEP